jgi:tRNA/rRNA methyltransferase
MKTTDHSPYALIRWILVETSHPGNLGSAARALKTMGFNQLALVKPRSPNMASDAEAIALASGASDVLAGVHEYLDLRDAVSQSSLVLGLTSRDREFGPPALSWDEALHLIVEASSENKPTSLMFGPERTGLSNDHLALCTHRVCLEANPDYPSLNLAQAVMVCAYSLRQQLLLKGSSQALENQSATPNNRLTNQDLADPAAVLAMLEHWQEGLIAIGYLDPNNPKKLMPRLQALFARSGLHKEEIDLLRGIAKQMLLKK